MKRTVDWAAGAVVVMLLAFLAVAVSGCFSVPKKALPPQTAYINPGPDVVDAATQQRALDRGALTIPESVSKMQDTGLAHFRQDEEVVMLPDGQPFLLDLGNGRRAPVYNRSASFTKWSSLHEVAGAKFGNLFLGIGSLFGTRDREAQEKTGALGLAGWRRDGFVLDIQGLEGDITKSSEQLAAVYDGKAKLQAMLNQGAEVGWAGAKGYITAQADGTAKVIATTAAGLQQIAGEVLKITPYGTANALGEKALKVLIRPTEADGTLNAGTAAQPVDVLPPSP